MTIIVFSEDTQHRIELLANHPNSQTWAETRATEYLARNEVDSETRIVTAQIIDRIEVGDFVMRGPTP